jgi:hypothetical protein
MYMFPALALVRKVSAVLVVHFAAGDWRIKGADQAHILGATALMLLIGNTLGFENAIIANVIRSPDCH